MKLYGCYLSLELEKPVNEAYKDPSDQNFFLNIENMYLLEMINSSKIVQGVQLSTGNFILQVHCGETELAEDWISHLAKYCIRSNVQSNYKIVQNLDSGGFAIVYLADRLTKKGGKVAIKMVDKHKIKTKRNYVG